MSLAAQYQFLRSQPAFQQKPAVVLWRLACWRLACATGNGRSIRLPGRRLNLFLPPDWHGSSKLLFAFRDNYEPDLNLLAKFLVAGGGMVDVGANLGVFSLVASKLVGDQGQVVAFEPTQRTFSAFQKNLELNGATNVVPLRLALADKPGKVRLYHHIDPTRNSLGGDGADQDFEEVEQQRLDDVLARTYTGPVQFVKIDVEGADELVCRGAVETFKRHRPAVLFENNPAAAQSMGLRGDGSRGVLSRLGYEFYTFADEALVRVETATTPEGNVIAVHPDGVKPR